MKTLHTIYSTFAKHNMAQFLTVLTVLFTLGVGNMWGAVVSGTTYSTANSMPTGWSKNGNYNNNNYLKLTYSANYIQTNNFCVNSFTSIKIKARMFGGPTEAQATITVEWIVDGSATTLGTITPSNTTLNDYTISSPASITANKEGYVKISCKGAGSDKGAGVSAVTITYTVGNCSGGGNTGGDSGDSGSDNDGDCVWTLVTDASSLVAGDEIVIAAKDYNYAISTTQNNNNRGRAAITKDGNYITFSNDVQILTLQNGKTSGTFAFQDNDGTNNGYLCAASSSENYLRTESTLSTNSSWKITIANDGTATIKAQGSYTRNTMQYNQSSSLFACYSSASQKALALYKKVCTSSAPSTYTVTYDRNGATSGSAPTDENSPYTANSSVTVLGNTGTLVKTGYTFNGWNTQADGKGTQYSEGDTFTITKDITLYAQWKANTYKVSFKANEGTGSMDDQTFTYDEAKKALSKNTFARTGYTFTGWNTQADGQGTAYADQQSVSNLTSENNVTITLYAQWKINTFTVTFDKNGGIGTMASQTFTYNQAQTLTQNTYTRTGYAFNGWNTQADGQGTAYEDQQSVTLTTAGLTLYAQWTAITYSVHFDGNESDGGSMDDQSFTYDKAQNLTPNAYSRTGYVFKHWTINQNGTGASYTDEKSVSNLTTTNGATVTLYAQWTKIHTITWNVAGRTSTTTILDGDKVELPDETPQSCSDKYTTFVGWYTEPAGADAEPTETPQGEQVTASTKPTDDATYYAVWADGGAKSEIVDIIDNAFTINSTQTNYTSWSGKQGASGTIYAGNSAGSHTSVQLRSNNSNSGVVTTTSGGKAIKVVVIWNSNTTNGRTLNIYGKNSAYTDATDLYDSKRQGILLGTIVCGTSTTLEITGDYEYIGLRSAESAMYLDEIQITWSVGSDPTGYISTCCDKYINIIKGDDGENGNFEISQSGQIASCDGVTISVTTTPSAHYHVLSVTETTGNAEIVDNSNGTYTITYAANSTGESTINVDFEEDTKYEVTWSVNGKSLTEAELNGASTIVYEGEKISKTPPAPNPDEFCGQVFVGWTDAEMDVNNTSKPTVYNQVDEFPEANGNQTFYAVFADYVTE